MIDTIVGEVNEKVEWGMGFVEKYAKWILTIVLAWVVFKGLKIKI
jgi:hypothetical protein